MTSDVDAARALMRSARQCIRDQVRSLSIDEALNSGTGARSGLGVLKHIGGWLWVYRSFAFEPEPKRWAQTSWPRGLRQTIDFSKAYLDEITAWIDAGLEAWDVSLAGVAPGEMAALHKLTWGATAPLSEIVIMAAQHVFYHAGEMNMLLSQQRGEAWEWGEEVEENHIDTFDFGVRPPWMSDEQASVAAERRAASRQ